MTKRKRVRYEDKNGMNGDHGKIWDKLWDLYGDITQVKTEVRIGLILLLGLVGAQIVSLFA